MTSPDDEASAAQELLREALIRVCSLDADAITKIAHASRVLDISFTDAAISTGFATQEDVDYAQNTLSHVLKEQPARARPSTELGIHRDPFDSRNERILALRTELLLRHDGLSRANMVAMISPCSGEGRSRLCADLAMSFAQLGHPTLLVDADLRNPRQHQLFCADNETGLSQAIAKRVMPGMQAVEGLPQMSLLTAGPKAANPLELLSDGHFERMVREWRHSFEFVVVDTPAVSRYSDGLAVATVVGRVLTLTRANHTPYREQKELLRRLSVTRAQVLGAVINHY